MDGLLNLFTNLLKAILSIFPDSPFAFLNNMMVGADIRQWFAYVNWFIPITSFLAIMELWLVCIAVYYVYQILLRAVKAMG